MKKQILVLLTCLVLPVLIFSQSLYKAQKMMDKYNYSAAIEILKKAKDKQKSHDEALTMLAECYRLQHDVLSAKSTYAQVVLLKDAKPEAFYYYAQALQASGNYTKAREMFQKYSEKNPSDPKGSLFVAHCDSVLGPWKARTPEYEVKIVKGINSAQSEFGPAIYDGELIFVSDNIKNPGEGKKYGWTGHGYLNIMRAQPEKAGDFWGNLGASNEFSEFNQKYHDGPAAFSFDGNSIYFTRSFEDKAKRIGIYKTELLKIFYSTKTNGVWGEIKPFYLNNTEYSVGHPALSVDGQTLYFVSDMPGGQGGTDIWMCKRENNEWGPAVNLGPNVNTRENEMFPSISNDGALFFASDGLPGYGALDIFKTRNENGIWLTPENLFAPVNGSFDDFAIAFQPDEKGGFFSTNRPEGVGSDDIFAFRIAQPATYLISGFVKDRTTMQPVAGATVFLFNQATGSVKVLRTNSLGMYQSLIDKPANFAIKAMAANYIADCSPLLSEAIKPDGTATMVRDLLLDKLIVNKTFKIDNIYYNFDKYNIRDDAKPELDKLVSIMNENEINVEIGSHTDCRGSFEYNDKLSQKRAESVVKYIISAGIDENRITAKGYGERQLVNKCADNVPCTPEEHQANRRTEFKITSLVVPVANPDQFDPGIYFEGQELYSKMLPPDFFNRCK
jgi:outer membrane protein OmpA-like peptidoglycan-associated protein